MKARYFDLHLRVGIALLGATTLAGAALHAAEPAPSVQRMVAEHTGRATLRSDSAAVVEAVDRFHRALAAGDSAAALALLTPDAVILESGGMETPAEYRSHHLPGDIAFAQAVKRERSAIRVTVQGDVAWATSTSTTVGEFRGRAVDAQGAELMVLRRDGAGWKIAAIHWSSRARRR